MMEAPRIVGIGVEPVPVRIVGMATMIAVAPVGDLFDRTGTINGRTQPCRGAKSRSVGAIRRQRPGRERSDGDVDEKKFSHRVLSWCRPQLEASGAAQTTTDASPDGMRDASRRSGNI